jgi:hypothetical protein
MRTVTIGGVEYACPFAGLFKPLSATEYAELRSSVADQNRFLYGVLVCTTPTHGKTFLDGLNRERVSRELGIPLRVTDLGEMSDEAALAVSRDANDRRRHLTPEEIAASRAHRDEMILKLRAEERLSTRTIAEKVGADHTTVSRVLKKQSDNGSVAPATVQSRDGKERPAYQHTPRVARRPSQEQAEPAEPAAVVVETVEQFMAANPDYCASDGDLLSLLRGMCDRVTPPAAAGRCREIIGQLLLGLAQIGDPDRARYEVVRL